MTRIADPDAWEARVDTSQPRPPLWRIALAFVVAPFVAALGLACVMPAFGGLSSSFERIVRSTEIYAFFGAYPPALLIGLPLVILLRNRVRPTLVTCFVVGFLVAALPWVILDSMSSMTYAYSSGHVTMENGRHTMWGWIDLLGFASFIGGFGVLAGLIFWVILVGGVARRPSRS